MNGLAGSVSHEDGFEGGVVHRASRSRDLRPDQFGRLVSGTTDDPQRGGRPYATYGGGHFYLSVSELTGERRG